MNYRPPASSKAVKKRMKQQRRRDTAPEVALRRLLHSYGCRYRVDYSVPGTRKRADIVFTRLKIAVFVDGCFWHFCPVHGSIPKKNRDWWLSKLEKNVKRDREVDAYLSRKGWRVIRIWEHEDPINAADKVLALVNDLRNLHPHR